MSVICIEGGDAAGKATQSKILADSLGAKLFSFPDYTTPAGKAILGHLTEKWTVSEPWSDASKEQVLASAELAAVDALALQSLMLTNRMERSAEMLAAKREGHVVLDRYIPSTLVYGGYDGLDVAWLERVNAQLPVQPDLYILLDAPVEEGMRRRPERRDRYERDRKRMEHVREAYCALFMERHAGITLVTQCATCGAGHAMGDAMWRCGNGHAGPPDIIQRPAWRVVNAVGSVADVAARVLRIAMPVRITR